MLETVQPISTAQLEAFTSKWAGNAEFAGGKGNNRAVQDLNSREVYVSSSSFAVLGSIAFALAALLTI